MEIKKRKFLKLAILNSICIWIFDALVDVLLFSENSFLQEALHPDLHGFYSRIVTVIVVFILTVQYYYLANRQRVIQDELNEEIRKHREVQVRLSNELDNRKNDELVFNEMFDMFYRIFQQILFLNEMFHVLNKCTTEQEVLNIVYNYSDRLFGEFTDSISIRLVKEGNLTLSFRWREHTDSEDVDTKECWIMRSKNEMLIFDPNAQQKSICSQGCENKEKHLCLPIRVHNESIGVISFNGKDLDKIKELAINLTEFLGSVIYSIRLKKELLEQSITDPLTRLYNRRYSLEYLAKEFKKAKRGGKLSLAMVDIDHFKTINDLYGHAAGDKVLKEFSRILTESLRETDIVCRYGGEEFLIGFPNTTAEILKKLEEIRNITEEKEVIYESAKIKFTVSIGVDSFRETDKSLDNIIDRADKALYKAKKGGRNRISF